MRCLLIAIVAGAAALFAAQMPPIGAIDVYGLRRVSADSVRLALNIRPGEPVPTGGRAALEARLTAVAGVAGARVQAVCCENGLTTLYVGIQEAGAPGPDWLPAPAGPARLPADVLCAGEEFEAALIAAMQRGEFGDDQTQGHSLLTDSAARAIQLRFVDVAARSRAILSDVLRTSADARQRALAAQILAYASDKRAVTADLERAMRDPDADVRNAALRALWLIAALAERRPELGIRVAPEPFIALLNSLEWSDRNKASFALEALTRSRPPRLLAQLRASALPALADIARWSAGGHAFPGRAMLGRLAGWTEEDIAAVDTPAEAETLIAAARVAR